MEIAGNDHCPDSYHRSMYYAAETRRCHHTWEKCYLLKFAMELSPGWPDSCQTSHPHASETPSWLRGAHRWKGGLCKIKRPSEGWNVGVPQNDMTSSWPTSRTQAIRVSSPPLSSLDYMFCLPCPQWEPLSRAWKSKMLWKPSGLNIWLNPVKASIYANF